MQTREMFTSLLPSKTKSVIRGFLLTFSDYFSLLNEKVPMSFSDNSEFCLNSTHHWHDTNISINTARSKQTSFVQRCLHFYWTQNTKLYFIGWIGWIYYWKLMKFGQTMAKNRGNPLFHLKQVCLKWLWPKTHLTFFEFHNT